MNLTEMTVADVDMLVARLQYLSEAGEQLRELGVEPVFRLMPGQPVVITAGLVLPPATEFGPPPPFEVETEAEFVERFTGMVARAQPQAAPNEIALAAEVVGGTEKPGGSGDLQQLDNVESTPADPQQREQSEALEGAACEPRAGAMPAGSIPADSILGGSAGPILGPMGEAEKAAIRDMAAKGMTLEQIVAATNRRVQSVASVLRAKPKETTGQPVPAASTSSTVAAVDANPETPAAGAEVPSADAGKPTREREAGVTAPEAGGAAPVLASGLTARQREIAAELAALGYRAPYTAKLDLDVAEDLMRGVKAPQIALDLGLDLKALSDRMRRIYDTIRDARSQVTLDGPRDLLAVLRHRAGVV